MSTWDDHVFGEDTNVDFLEELQSLEREEIVQAVHDAVILAESSSASSEEKANGYAAATIAAIWAGAPFSAGEVVEDYPFIRKLRGAGGETLNEKSLELLESLDTDYDLEPFMEALS